MPIGQANAKLNLAQVELGDGNLEAAERHLEAACDQLTAIGALEGRREVVVSLRLALAAGRRDRERFRDLWKRLEDGWPDGWQLVRDHPWLLAIAADLADLAGWQEAEELRALASELEERLSN